MSLSVKRFVRNQRLEGGSRRLILFGWRVSEEGRMRACRVCLG